MVDPVDVPPGEGRSIRGRRAIAAPAGEVWAAISVPGNLEPCHPFCAHNPVVEWPGAGSRDEIHYLSGWIYERRFTDWIDGVGYDLEIWDRDQLRSLVEWRIRADGDDAAALDITVRPRPVWDVPAPIRAVPEAAYVRPLLRRYLASVVGGVEWFVTRGEPVPRNQFGRHPWFSEKRSARRDR